MIVPAVLAACERHNPDGPSALLGIAVGVETMCRLSLVAPTLTHKAGFHPTAVFGAMAAENSILWWSSSHRVHHKHVDHDWDPYNIKRGFWWAHLGWILVRRFVETDYARIKDFASYPELRWLNRWHLVPPTVLLPVLGILSMTGEWSQRTALTTFTLVPAWGL